MIYAKNLKHRSAISLLFTIFAYKTKVRDLLICFTVTLRQNVS